MLKKHFTREELKDKLGEENIFIHYFGDFNIGSGYNSVFRKDEKASTGFYISKSGSIIYNDLTTGEKYDFVHFVMKLLGLNYYNALTQIAVDFGLIKGKRSSGKVAILNTKSKAKTAIKKAININTCKFKKEHLDFWANYGITLEELKESNIRAIKSFTINKFDADNKLISTFNSPLDNNLKFVYIFNKEGEQYVKIYIPHSKDFKWFGDVPLTVPFGLDNIELNKKEILIITKSVKDTLVLRKFFKNVIGLQNESPQSIEPQLLKVLINNFKEVYIWFDNDAPGIKAANYYSETYGLKTITTPNTSEKDPSDFVEKYGIDIFKKYLQYIKII